MGAMASQITSHTIVYSTVYSGENQRKHQSSASLAFVRWIHQRPVNSPHKWPVTREMFSLNDVIMLRRCKPAFPTHVSITRPRVTEPRCWTLWVCTETPARISFAGVFRLGINSLPPGRFEWNFREEIFMLNLLIDGWGIPSDIALRWLSINLNDDKSTLVQVMAWCRLATGH